MQFETEKRENFCNSRRESVLKRWKNNGVRRKYVRNTCAIRGENENENTNTAFSSLELLKPTNTSSFVIEDFLAEFEGKILSGGPVGAEAVVARLCEAGVCGGERGKIWAYVCQCRGKKNPLAWLNGVLKNGKHPPSEVAFVQARTEARAAKLCL
jgi:hypothetical protein